MPGMLDKVDPEGLREFSVVYSDRSLNHMSHCFQQVMRDLSQGLKAVYRAYHTVLVPGSGTFAMEAVARQFATGRQCLVIRNGWFSYRWSQIFEMGQIPASETVLKARPVTAENDQPHRPFAPVALEEVLATIADQKPDVVFAPHVETSAGMRLPEAYLRAVAESVHQYGGLFVLDCIASGCDWVDMDSLGIDVLVSAPQKGWSSSPCCGVVMLSELAAGRLADSQSTSFACDLRKWRDIMAAYESGGHAYHATMPTDSLRVFRDTLLEMQSFGFDHLKAQQLALGQKVRAALTGKGLQSVAAPGFEAASVVVCFAPDGDWQSGANFKKLGIQIAAGVPLQCDEGDAFKTFRIGLFGLEKLAAVEEAADFLSNALNQLHGEGTPLA